MRFKLKRNDQIGLLFFIAFVVGTSLMYQFEERFNDAAWRDQPSKRHQMVDDLIEKNLLTGKTKIEVMSLLGPPSSDYSLENDFFIYNLGSPPSFTGYKIEELHIVFENQKAFKVFVTQH